MKRFGTGEGPPVASPSPGGKRAAIKATGLRKHFRQAQRCIEVLKGVDFTVQEGEIVAIVGPSGAGKSTLLHLLGLMDHPSGGALTLFGESTARLSEATASLWRNRWIGFLFQFHHLLPELSVWENVMLPLWVRGIDRRTAAGRARTILEPLGLVDRLAHRPAELSGGEQQRVAFARALVPEPRLLLADEPTGNLDQTQGEEMRRLLWTHARRRQMTVVLVTHQQGLAAAADRCLMLIDGRFQ